MSDPRAIMDVSGRLRLRILSDDDVARVHAAALEALGAAAAARSAPGSFTLGGRVREHNVAVGAGRVWLAAGVVTAGPETLPARVRPFAGGDPVPATAADLEAVCTLADALPEVAVVAGPPVRAAGENALGELARCFAATSKHVILGTLGTTAEAEAAVRMAIAVAGSEAAMRERPPLSLCGGPAAIEPALVFARAGLPTGLVCPPFPAPSLGGADAPDVAAALVRSHAGVLAGCAAVQAAAPGAPFLYVADPRPAGLPSAGPATARFLIAAAQLAAHVGLPFCAAGLGTASHEPDWQACTQDALASLSVAAAGAGLTAGAGTLGAGATFSLQQLVMDSEIFSWNAAIAAGIFVDDETIALETIREVDICGNFLGQRHTRRHMKDVWRPRLLDRSMWDAWVAADREGAYEKATALAGRLLAEHRAVPLDDGAAAALAAIVAEAVS